jgi:acetyl esterase/lipase
LQFGDVRLPKGDGPHPVVVVIHGGFWRARYGLEFMGHACADLTARGVATWNIEYRRIGDEGGAWPNTLLDAGMAVDHVRKLAANYKLDLNRVVVIGHSAGGHLACWVAGRSRIPEGDPLYRPDPLPLKGVVSLAGVLDLRQAWKLNLSNGVVQELMAVGPDEAPTRYATASPLELLPLGVPQVLVHGTADPNVPYSISQDYYTVALSKHDPVKLVTLPGVGHFEVINPESAVWPLIVEETLNLLK